MINEKICFAYSEIRFSRVINSMALNKSTLLTRLHNSGNVFSPVGVNCEVWYSSETEMFYASFNNNSIIVTSDYDVLYTFLYRALNWRGW